MDKVSVIVPAWNVGRYLPRTLDSLLGQTYGNLEILVIDDASTDDTRGVISHYAAWDDRIVPLIQTTHRGVGAARNRGLDAAVGDWICFCDGDDWYEPEFVARMLACAKTEGADFVFCDYWVVRKGQKISAGSVGSLKSGCDIRRVIACGPLASCTHMIHRDLFQRSQVRYPEDCRRYEELSVIPVLASHAARIGVCREALYGYYQRGDGTSASNAPMDSEGEFRRGYEKLAAALGPGYDRELEYHAIYALFYGEVLKSCKEGLATAAIREQIDRYHREFPQWEKNPYLGELGQGKRLFLALVARKWIVYLRVLAALHGKVVG